MTADLVPVDLQGGALRLAGVLHLQPAAAGHTLHRLPAWTQPQITDPLLTAVQSMPSGCRIEVVTDATAIELDVQLTILQIGDAPARGAAFDLVIDGVLVKGHHELNGNVLKIDMETGAIDMSFAGPATVRFDLPAGEKHVEVWLPHASAVDLIEVRVNGSASAPPQDKRRWVHHGSSISHCLEAERPTGVWPAVAARLAGVDLQSLGLAGQCQLDGFTARTIRDLPADVISVKAGINVVNGDTMRERTFASALHAFLDTIREGHPEVPLLVVSPIYCGPHEAHPGPSLFKDGKCTAIERPTELAAGALTLQRIRQLEGDVVTARQATDPNLHLLDGLELFGADDAHDLPDDLHPNPAGYQRIGERFHAAVFGPDGVFAG